MADFLRYDHFEALDAPIVVLSPDGRVLYRNRAAIGFSPDFRLGGRCAASFGQGDETLKNCIRKRKPTIAPVRLKNGGIFTSLLIPDYSPEGAAVLMVLAPLLEGRFCYAPSRAAFSSPFVEDVATLPDGRILSQLGEVLVRSYSALFAPPEEQDIHTMGALCRFLNRLFEHCFSFRSPFALAKCTGDCLNIPLRNFEGLASALSCLSILLAVNAADEKLDVYLCCRNDRACFDLSLRAADCMCPSSLPELLPGRKVELSILNAYFDHIGYDVILTARGGTLDLQFFGRDRFPYFFFKAPDADAERREILAVEELLSKLLEQASFDFCETVKS